MDIALVPLLVAVVAGVSMALQGSLNTCLSKVIGLLEANFIVHVIGAAALVALLLLKLGQGDLSRIGEAPGMPIWGHLERCHYLHRHVQHLQAGRCRCDNIHYRRPGFHGVDNRSFRAVRPERDPLHLVEAAGDCSPGHRGQINAELEQQQKACHPFPFFRNHIIPFPSIIMLSQNLFVPAICAFLVHAL